MREKSTAALQQIESMIGRGFMVYPVGALMI
jgi:hypothetical protein